MAVRLSPSRTGRPLPPGRFLVLISVKRLSRPHGHSAAGRIRSIEKSSDLIGDRTRDLPACRVVPQPTTLLRAPSVLLYLVRAPLYIYRSRDSSVGIATGYGPEGWGSISGMDKRIFSTPHRPDRLWSSPSLPSSGYRVLFPRGKVTGA
jgi:hypothetical protein